MPKRPPKAPIADVVPAQKLRLYTVQIIDVAESRDVILAAVQMTDAQRRDLVASFSINILNVASEGD